MCSDAKTTISQISWGQITVSVGVRSETFKDCKVWPGGACAWDWSDTGTRHSPGIQPADIEEILAKEVDVVILSKGMLRMLKTCPETEALLRERGVDYHIEQTMRAAAHFNDLAQQGRRVAGVFHSTC